MEGRRMYGILSKLYNSLDKTYKVSKFFWITQSLGLAIPIIAIIYEVIDFYNGFEFTIPTILMWSVGGMFMWGLSISERDKEAEKKKRREHPCPMCKGTGYTEAKQWLK